MVTPTIIIPASQAWDYFCDNEEALTASPQVIASCPETGIEIVIYVDSYGLYSVEVSDDYAVLETAKISYPIQAEAVMKRLYETYLTDEYVDHYNDYKEEYDDETEFDIMAEMRDEELSDATIQFLYTVLGEEVVEEIDPDKVEQIKNKILECLAKCEGFPIYRPMVLETKDGTIQVSYPYDEEE